MPYTPFKSEKNNKNALGSVCFLLGSQPDVSALSH